MRKNWTNEASCHLHFGHLDLQTLLFGVSVGQLVKDVNDVNVEAKGDGFAENDETLDRFQRTNSGNVSLWPGQIQFVTFMN